LLHYVYAGNLPLNLLSWQVLLGSVCGFIEFLFHYLHAFSLLFHDNHPGLVSFTWFCILNSCWCFTFEFYDVFHSKIHLISVY
jgi:hypothetical protein